MGQEIRKKKSEMQTQHLMRKSHVHLTLWKFEINFQLSHGVEGLTMVGILGKYVSNIARAASTNTDGVSCTQKRTALCECQSRDPLVQAVSSLAKLTRRPHKADQMTVNKGECLLLANNEKTVQCGHVHESTMPFSQRFRSVSVEVGHTYRLLDNIHTSPVFCYGRALVRYGTLSQGGFCSFQHSRAIHRWHWCYPPTDCCA